MHEHSSGELLQPWAFACAVMAACLLLQDGIGHCDIILPSAHQPGLGACATSDSSADSCVLDDCMSSCNPYMSVSYIMIFKASTKGSKSEAQAYLLVVKFSEYTFNQDKRQRSSCWAQVCAVTQAARAGAICCTSRVGPDSALLYSGTVVLQRSRDNSQPQAQPSLTQRALAHM